MQKVKVSVCGQHLYAEPVKTPLLFVLLHPPSVSTRRRLHTIALANGYNGHAVTWLCSARVESRRALLMAEQPWLTATGQDKLWAAVAAADRVVAAWGQLPANMAAPDFKRQLLCMGRTADGSPVHPLRDATFREY